MSEFLKEFRTFSRYIARKSVSFLPPERIEKELFEDYRQMKIGFIYADAPSFSEIMERLRDLQNRFRALEWDSSR